MIDWRSDTVTQPTPAMLEAMMSAPTGDDVFGEDPTINALEAKAAKLFGMEAALFCPSGTMTNQLAVKVHVQPGDEVICDRLCHIYNYEGGGVALNSGASVRLLEGPRGQFGADDVVANINSSDSHYPVSKLVSVENTSNRGGGACYDFSKLEAIRVACDEHQLGFHLDGARLFNALVRKGESPRDYGNIFDTISICLSKGLGAPVGSILLGDTDRIHRARRFRKAFGGGMRQAGFLAGAGIYALDHHVERLADDHRRAEDLGTALAELAWVEEVLPVETNIVVANHQAGVDRAGVLNKLAEAGIGAMPFGPTGIRFVAHLDITEEGLDQTVATLRKL